MQVSTREAMCFDYLVERPIKMPSGVYKRSDEYLDTLRDRFSSLPKNRENNPNWRGGKSSHPLYFVYHDMKSRCGNPKHVGYADYGGRGISVHPEWRDDFWAFVRDVGERPEGKTSAGWAYWQLDRIDNDGNYEPGNVRWASPSQQANNKRKRKVADSCRRGHSLLGDNLVVYPNGARRCRICVRRNEFNRTRSRQRRGEI